MNKKSKATKVIIKMDQLGYTVDSKGQVYSPYNKPIGSMGPDGYVNFSMRLEKSKGPTVIGLHRYVAYKKFGSKIFDAGIQCRHLNDIKHDNRPDNIELGTAKDNYLDSLRNNIKRGARGLNHHKLLDSIQDIGFNNTVKSYGVSKETLRQVKIKYSKQ